jgi:hypothetical protein
VESHRAVTSVIAATSEPAGDVEALARLDAVAASLLSRLAPIRCAVAVSAAEREDVFRLRYRAVVDRGWLRQEDLPGGLEREDADERAVLVGAWDGRTLVAAARLIFPTAGERLPVETAFGVDLSTYGRAVQVDRVTVDRRARDRDSRLLIGVIARCWLEMRSRGFSLWAGIDSPGMLRLYRRLGFEMTIVGPSRRYWGEERFPVLFDPVAAAPRLVPRLGDRA